jgi:hypothetical protein
MNRTCEWALRLGSLGVVLLLISILLVPQSRALAGETGAVCEGDATCNNNQACFILAGDCPNPPTCSAGGVTYCHCVTDAANCKDCKCQRSSVDGQCYCLK